MKGDTASAPSSLEPAASSAEVLGSNVKPMMAPSGEPRISSVVPAPSNVQLAASSIEPAASNVEPAANFVPTASSVELTASNFEKTCSSGITTVAIFIKVGIPCGHGLLTIYRTVEGKIAYAILRYVVYMSIH